MASGSNGMMKSPSGLFCSEAIFASRRLGARPTEQVTPHDVLISARRRSASVRMSPKRWTVPVTSRNASSTETPSTNGE